MSATGSTIGDHDMAKEQYDNTNSGALFRNNEKTKETDRDYSGTLNVAGEEFWLSGWIRVSKKGDKFLSLSIKPKDTPAAPRGDPGDEIPF